MDRQKLKVHLTDGSLRTLELPSLPAHMMRDAIFAVMKEGFSQGEFFYPPHRITMVELVKDEPPPQKKKPVIEDNCKTKSKNSDPDDMCKRCNCWKMTREHCS